MLLCKKPDDRRYGAIDLSLNEKAVHIVSCPLERGVDPVRVCE